MKFFAKDYKKYFYLGELLALIDLSLVSRAKSLAQLKSSAFGMLLRLSANQGLTRAALHGLPSAPCAHLVMIALTCIRPSQHGTACSFVPWRD